MNIKRISALILCVAAVLSFASCAVVRYDNNAEVYGFAYSTEFFGKEETLPEKYKNAAATVTMCKNERETAYVAISDAKKELTGVKFSFGEFSDGEHIFPSDKIEGYKMSYAEKFDEEKHKYYTEPFGYLPLTDFTNNSTVASAENQAYALRFETSADTPAGTYRGTATLEYDGGKKDVEVVVTVLDITLPENSSFAIFIGSWLYAGRYYYDGYMTEDEMTEMFLDFAEEQRIPLSNGFGSKLEQYPTDGLTGMAATVRQYKYYLEDHPNAFIQAVGFRWYYGEDIENIDIRSKAADDFYAAAVADGIADRLVYYPFDEPEKNEATRATAKEILRQFKEYYPEIKVILTASPIERYYADEASLFVPFFYNNLAEDYIDFGEEKPLWVYFLEERHASGWYTSMIGATGYLQWEYGLFCGWNDDEGLYNKKLTTEEIWNGEGGTFVLPGRIDDGIVNENRAVTTTCAEGIRDAAEEYDKLVLFREKAKALYDELGITEYSFDDVLRSVYTNIIETHTYNDDPDIPADIFFEVQKEIYRDIVEETNSFTVISENRSEEDPNGVLAEVFTRKGSAVTLDGKAAEEVVDCGTYEKHIFKDSATAEVERHTVTVDGRSFVKTYRMTIYEELVTLLDIENNFDAIKSAMLANNRTTISADNIEKVEINGKTTMKITFSSDADQIALKGSDFSTASWKDCSSVVLGLEKGEGNVRSNLTMNISAGLATVSTQTGVKVYWQNNATAVFDLTQGAVSSAKKNTIKRVIFGVTEPTTVYITDISLGK